MPARRPNWAAFVLVSVALAAGAGLVLMVFDPGGRPPAPAQADPAADGEAEGGTAAASPSPAPEPEPEAGPDADPDPDDAGRTAVADAGPAGVGEAPRLWAVVVGIERYDGAIPTCIGAAEGARAVRRLLVEQAGWPGANVRLLTDDGADEPGPGIDPGRGLRPTRRNLLQTFSEWLPARAGPEDLIVVYFAGQAGMVEAGADAPGGGTGRAALLPIDADPGAVGRTGVVLDEAMDGLASSRDHTIVCWLDTSLAGRGRPFVAGPAWVAAARAAEAGEAATLPEAPTADPWLARLTRWPGVSAWLAADRAVAAQPSVAGRHSPFTDALLRGLGAAASDGGTLHDALASVLADPALARQNLRVQGGLRPGIGLRPGAIARRNPGGPRELVLQQGHGSAVTALHFSPDGDWLVSAADREASVKVWQFDDDGSRVLRSIALANNGVSALELGRRGKGLLMVADGNGALVSIDMDDGFRRSPPAPPERRGPIAALAALPGVGLVAALVDDERTGRAEASLRTIDEPWRPVRALRGRPSALIPAPEEADWSFALARSDTEPPTLAFYDDRGQPTASVPGPGGWVDSARADAAGTLLAASDDRGGLVVYDTTAWVERLRLDLGAPADRLAVSPRGRVAVASGRTLRVFDLADGDAVELPTTPIDRPLVALACSPDGSWLAACPQFESHSGGAPLLWRIDGDAPEPVALDCGPAAGAASALAFSPDGKTLVAGDSLGGLRRWSLLDRTAGPYRDPRRGMVRAVDASADGGALLQVTRDGVALFWDLDGGRGPRPLPGLWTSGVLLPPPAEGGAPRLALTSRTTFEAGEVVLVDSATGRRLSGVAPPIDGQGEPIPNLSFAGLVVSADGRRIAAYTPGGGLVACWDAASGAIVAVLDGVHFPEATAVDLSADGRVLLTAGSDGARLWDLGDGPGPDGLRGRSAVDAPPDDRGKPVPIASARIRPGSGSGGEGDGPIEVGLGLADGRIARWSEGEAAIREVGRQLGAVGALAFSGDGRWLVAGGADRQIWVWDLAAPRPVGRPPAVGPGSAALSIGGNHSERVNALAFVRDRGVFLSGGDDGLARIWRPAADGGALLGSLSADQDSGQWVAYTPDGLFDCSPMGADRVSWRWGDEGLVGLDSYPASHRVFGLAGRLIAGDEPPRPGSLADPPRLTIDGPADRVVLDREVELAIWLDRPEFGSLRVYQDGVPVLAAPGDDDAGDDGQAPRLRRDPENPRRWFARVRLHSGTNRFHAMSGPASRSADLGEVGDPSEADSPEPPEGPDGHSEPIEVVYGGADPDAPGLVHVIALGVGDYRGRGRSLRFATRDAEAFARFVADRAEAPGRAIGRRHVLLDRDATAGAVDAAFEDVRRAVRGRPQDTVVLFLAGHADALGDGRRDRFFLLLPDFPFPEPGTDRERAERQALAHRDQLLPFGALYARLLHLDALQRVVVVDACQAEAIRADDSVRRVQELIDAASYEAKTSYYLASSRQGEPAGEAPELGHGLLTYAMLRGLGMPVGDGPGRLPPVPGPSPLDDLPNADRQPADGYVTTGELRSYVDWAVPLLARRFPDLALRAGVDGRAGPDPAPPAVGLADAGFTLLRLPERPEEPAPPPAAD